MANPQTGPSRFAHLARTTAIGSGTVPAPVAAPPARAARAEDDEDMETDPNEPGADTSDTDEQADAEDGDGKKAKGKKAKKAKKARSDDEDPDDDDDDDEDEDGDDDGDREEMAATSAVRAARMHERGRIAAIFAHPAAAANMTLACELAFHSDLSRKKAVKMLRAGGGSGGGSRLAQAMAGIPSPRVGADAPAPAGGTDAVVARITANYEAARGLKKGG